MPRSRQSEVVADGLLVQWTGEAERRGVDRTDPRYWDEAADWIAEQGGTLAQLGETLFSSGLPWSEIHPGWAPGASPDGRRERSFLVSVMPARTTGTNAGAGLPF